MHLKLSSGIWRPFCLGLNVFKSRRHIKCYSVFIGIDDMQYQGLLVEALIWLSQIRKYVYG